MDQLLTPSRGALFGSIAAGAAGTYYLLRKWSAGGVCHHTIDLHQKNVIITGSNTGIGKETAKALAKMGAHVTLASRNKELSEKAVQDIKEYSKNDQVEWIQLDLASFESIKNFVAEWKKRDLPIHILVNNAGVMAPPFTRTKDGFELQIGTNHLGHFLLTNLLFDNLAANNARVVNVSSIGHLRGTIDFDSFRGTPETYDKWKGYSQSKLANLLFSNELNRKFKERGSKATSNALHPGVVSTELGRGQNSVFQFILNLWCKTFGKNVVEGAQTTIYCCIAPELEGVGGKYYADCHETWSAALGKDEALAKKLWTVSEELVGLKH